MSKFGLTMFVTDETIDIVTLARKAEALGFESLFVPEHPIIPDKFDTPFAAGGPLPDWYRKTIDPFCGLAAAAAVTTKLRIGTAICLVPERDPLLTAKEVATVDLLSGGRFEFGVGAGWLREESEILGVDFPRRWTQTKDYVLAMKACWGPHPSEYHGKYADFPALWCDPKPVQKPHPPVLMAGEGAGVARRIAEFGDGWLPRWRGLTPQALQDGRKRVEDAMRAAGRDPATLTVSVFGGQPDKEKARDFLNAGAERVILMLPSEDEAKTTARLEEWAGLLL
ncbi:MAG TPA: LLM class F420-dependent oxidoreductase [bacterium]|nr:LLM class F420-dependent oxidoreductase [bacterium]